jgi:4-hydroxy-tetrahydrodipicolinate reductase
MRIAILGYGKMGKEIEKLAIERKHSVELIIDINNKSDLNKENLSKTEVAIDFSTPGSAYDNIIACFDANTPIVSGTTGWLDKFEEITRICMEKNQSFFYASNYSIGVYLFTQINKYLAGLMNNFDNYNVEIEEIHHTQKLDAPSGTAISLAQDIISNLKRKSKWELDKAVDKDSIKIKAIREDNIPGIHTITYDSPVDSIEIRHSAKSRKGLALGAIMAAEFLYNKKGIFTMNDLLKL